MTAPLVQLTLVVPTTVEDEVVEVLLSIDPPLGGFTSVQVDGHGFSFADAAMVEQVRGRMARAEIRMVVDEIRVPSVLEHLRRTIRFRHGTWWTQRIEGFGKL